MNDMPAINIEGRGDLALFWSYDRNTGMISSPSLFPYSNYHAYMLALLQRTPP
jgi:hypothetical protein